MQKNGKILFALGWIIVMTAALPYLILKGNMVVPFQDQLDGEVLCYMPHAKYLFSAVRIPNAEELGMTLLRDEPFETPDSYYAVYLYGL